MAILVINSGETTDNLFIKIKQSILDGISDANKEIECFDMDSLKFKMCKKESCSEREFDKHSPMGCRKHRECIEGWNANIVDSVYSKMIAAEAIVFLVKGNERLLNILIEQLLKKEHAYWEKNLKNKQSSVYFFGGLLKKKKMLFVGTPGEYEYSSRVSHIMSDCANKIQGQLCMHIVDMFIIDSDNEKYMLPVIRYAVNTLSMTYQDLNKDVNEWYKHHHNVSVTRT